MIFYGILLVGSLILTYVFLRVPWASSALISFLIPIEALCAFHGRTILVPIGALAMIAWIGRTLVSDKSLVVAKRTLVFLSAWMVWVLMSVYWAIDVGVALSCISRLISLVGLFFLVQGTCSRRQSIESVFLAVLAGATTAGLWGILSYLSRGALRMTIAEQGPNHSARIFATAILIVPYLFYRLKRPFLRILLFASLTVNALALILTGSRGAIAALAISFLGAGLIVPVRQRRASRYRFLALLISVGVILYALVCGNVVPQFAIDRLANFQAASMLTATGRTIIWNWALESIMESPFTGVGIGNFLLLFDGLGAHNLFVAVQTELGVIGTMLFLLFLGSVLWPLLRVRGDIMGVTGLLLVLFALASGLSFEPMYTKLFWLTLSIGVAVPMVIAKEQRGGNPPMMV